MKFIKPKDWITPEKNKESSPLEDCCIIPAEIETLAQEVSYPVAAVVSGIGLIVTKGKHAHQ